MVEWCLGLAVGLVTQLLTPWFNAAPEFVYLDYDDNRGTLVPNARITPQTKPAIRLSMCGSSISSKRN